MGRRWRVLSEYISSIPEASAISHILTYGFDEWRDIDETYFVEPYRSYFVWLRDMEKETGAVPTKELFLSHFDDDPTILIYDVSTTSADTIKKMLLDSRQAFCCVSTGKDITGFIDKYSQSLDYTSFDTDLRKLCEDHISRFDSASKSSLSVKTNCLKWLAPDKSEKLCLGFKELDDEIGGLRKKASLTLVQGSTGQGKSWILIHTLFHSITHGKRAVIYSDEMTKEDICKRLFAMLLGISVDSFEYDTPENEIVEKLKSIEDAFIVQSSDISGDVIDGLYSICKKEKADILLIDGIKYMSVISDRARPYEAMEIACRRLMTLSTECDCAVVAAAQSNRGAENENVGSGKGTIAGSYDMLGIATAVIALNRENDDFILSVEKSRHSSDGKKFVYTFDWFKSSFSYKGTKESDDLSDVPDASSLVRKNFKKNEYVCDVHSKKDADLYMEFSFEDVYKGAADDYKEELRAWNKAQGKYTDYMSVSDLKKWISRNVIKKSVF